MKKGWEVKKLGDVCEVIAGQSPESKFYNTIGEGLPFYQGKKEFADKFIGSPKTWTTKITKEAIANDVLMSVRAPVGPVNFANQKICIGRGLAAIRAGNLIDKEFLFYFLIKHENEIIGNSGAVFNSINKTQIKNIQIPLPPLPEQKRIVAILDKAFTAIERAKANTEENLQNAKEIFESYLQSVFENRGEDWEEKKLGEVCSIVAGQSPKSIFYNSIGEGLPFYQGKKEFTDKFVGEPKIWTTKITKEAIQNDILMSVRAPVGPINFATQKICIGRGLAAIRAYKSIDKEFVFSFLLHHKNSIVGNAGAVFNSINKTQICAIQIPVPTLKEQHQLVKTINKIQDNTQKLQSIYEQKLIDLEELKKSLLQKAFNGELI
ncbi:restriction endonuclease subunit S [bacterium]|nr:restriction endonuclease subunit S [bacterium]